MAVPPPPSPRVSPNTILGVGCVLYILANIWPPLIMFVTYLLYKFVPYAYRVNDDPTSRRKLWAEFDKQARQEKKDWLYLLVPSEEVILKEEYWVNERGMCLFTATMTPKNKDVEAVVCFCHGYKEDTTFPRRQEYERLVKRGIAVVSIEYEGHGRSDGELGYLPDWKKNIDDVSSFFKEITNLKFQGKKCFLMGESMGGAVAFDTYQRDPAMWAGVVFVSPMCKIPDDTLPPQWLIDLLKKLLGPSGYETMLGRLPFTPSAYKNGFKLDHKKELAESVPTFYNRKPRLSTARELLLNSTRISSSLKEFDAPFLVMHGLEDKVTDPQLSQALYDVSKSKDKEIKLYKGMWHAIDFGEPAENIDLVFSDAISWIEARI